MIINVQNVGYCITVNILVYVQRPFCMVDAPFAMHIYFWDNTDLVRFKVSLCDILCYAILQEIKS